MARKIILILLISAMFTAIPSETAENATDDSTPVYGYKIINAYPHDIGAFTQGLVYDGDVLYEGTGLSGRSTLRRVDLETGRVLEQVHLPDRLFGEGIAIWKDRLVQLTWQSCTGLVYDKENLSLAGNFSYRTEGWGITSDEKHLIMSDGTDTLYLLNPDTFKVTGTIKVRYNGQPVKGLNELEYIKGEIYANVWPTSRIAIISPENGEVRAWINLDGLLSKGDSRNASARVDVLNGIAYDREGDRLFVTGKLWPSLFEIKLASKGDGNYSVP